MLKKIVCNLCSLITLGTCLTSCMQNGKEARYSFCNHNKVESDYASIRILKL